MQVYKFGGASIATPMRAEALLPIISEPGVPLLVVISAKGKVTNELEKIVDAACTGPADKTMNLLKNLQNDHIEYSRTLLNDDWHNKALAKLAPYFAELEAAIQTADPSRYDYSYDRIVCLGEILSTIIIHFMLLQHGFENVWVDARSVIRTDDTYRDAKINWEHTALLAKQAIGTPLLAGYTVITQGFIGSSSAGKPVTLGREGSDYTAAVLAAMLQMKAVTIWKDVEGLRNADPKKFADTQMIAAISYNEVIEMAFYGAQIIHPKTIKPLQNNNIPLYVKCFLDPTLAGSVIRAEVNDAHYPPLIVLKENQVLIQVTTRDFSFITEDNLSDLYATFHRLKIKVNLIQNAAISFVACIDNRADRIKALTNQLTGSYKVLHNENVELLTIRHYDAPTIDKMLAGKQVLLRQETRKTIQVVMKANPAI